MFMFNDFDYDGVLEAVDELIREHHYGSYNDLMGLTVRELIDIINTITNKEREKQLKAHQGEMEQATRMGVLRGP